MTSGSGAFAVQRLLTCVATLLAVVMVGSIYLLSLRYLSSFRSKLASVARITLLTLGIANIAASCAYLAAACVQYMYNRMPETPELSDVPWGFTVSIVLWTAVVSHIAACFLLVRNWGPRAQQLGFELEERLKSCRQLGQPQPEDECPICYASLLGRGAWVAPPCGHNFHMDCLKSWLAHRGTCPVCRYDLVQHPV